MRNHTHRRLRKLMKAIDDMPLPATAVREAFERFRERGELPDDQRLPRAGALLLVE